MISSIFRKASRWIFFAALAYAPWAYGATTSVSINITNWVLLVALVLWGAELLTGRRRPRLPRFLIILTGALICVGGWMALNAKSIYDSEFSLFVPLRNFVPFLTGSVDYANSAAWMLRGALLLGTILFVCDLSQSSRWLLRLWYVISLIGGSIAFLGLLQKATGAQMIFWQPPPPPEYGVTTFFATYFYHGNAGAFLNLVWPLIAGLVIRAFTSRSQPGMRALWTIVFIITIGGSGGEYVTHGPSGRACFADHHWPAFWPGIVAKTTRCAEERRHRRRACPYFGADCIGSSDSSGTTA